MLYEIHMLKNYAPTNLNRDDTGSPKTCLFGGVQRGRVSSQCLKRSWRTSDRYARLLEEPAMRTRGLPALVAKELQAMGLDPEMIAELKMRISGIANKKGDEEANATTKQIVIYSPEDIQAIAKIATQFASGKSIKDVKKSKATDLLALIDDYAVRPVTLDIALFGRMVTSEAFRDVEAAMQVAHAISTHAVSQESDYYTAVDDLLENSDESGAAMIGDIDYNSCCYYHYASIDTDQLTKNLEHSTQRQELIRHVLPALIDVMALTSPSGKQNSFAGYPLPDLILVEVKEDKVPVSYANAYAVPARVGYKVSLVEDSVQKLVKEVNMTDTAFNLGIKHRAWFCPRFTEQMPERGTHVNSLKELEELAAAWSQE